MLIKINVVLTQVDRAMKLQLSHLVSHKLESVIGFSSLFSPFPPLLEMQNVKDFLSCKAGLPSLQKHEVLPPASHISFPTGDWPTDSLSALGTNRKVQALDISKKILT